MAKTIKNFISAFFVAFFTKWMEDAFILSGIALVVLNTYLISSIQASTLAGNYTLAAVLILFGLVIAKRG